MFALREKYKNEIIPQLKSELNISNPMLLPRLEKICWTKGSYYSCKKICCRI